MDVALRGKSFGPRTCEKQIFHHSTSASKSQIAHIQRQTQASALQVYKHPHSPANASNHSTMLRRAFAKNSFRYRNSIRAVKICLPVANNFHVKSRTHESLKSSDLDRWTNYLGGKGITTNPFGRSQLETNSYELKLAFGLSETGAKMKFSIAYQIRTQLVSSVTEHDQGGEQRDSKHHAQISVISSLPGGRKTRL